MIINGNNELPFHTTRSLNYFFKVLKIQCGGMGLLEWEHSNRSVATTIAVKNHFILPCKVINAHIPAIPLLGVCIYWKMFYTRKTKKKITSKQNLDSLILE